MALLFWFLAELIQPNDVVHRVSVTLGTNSFCHDAQYWCQ